MGLSWGIGGLVAAKLISWAVDHAGRPALLFLAFIPSLVLSALGAAALPQIGSSSAQPAARQGTEIA
jgi:hypothetical protein